MAVKPAVKEAAIANAVKHRLVGNIGAMTDNLVSLRDRKRALEEQIKEIETEYDLVSEQLMKKLEAEGTTKADGKLGSVSISVSTVANVLDWDVFNAWVKKTGYFHLYQRRIADVAWREIFDKKGAIPGTQPFSKKRLNVRTAA